MDLNKKENPDQNIWVAVINDLRYTPPVLVDSAFTAEDLAQERVDALNRERTLPGFIRNAEVLSIPLFSTPTLRLEKKRKLIFMAMVEDLREAAAWLKTLTEEASELSRAEESSAPSNTPAAQLIAATADNPVFMSIVIRMMEEAANSLVEAVETSGALTQLLGMTGGGVHAPVIKIAQSVLEVKAKTTGSAK